MELKIYYSVDKIDNIPVVKFFESEELAEYHQSNLDNPWTELVIGSITLDSYTDIKSYDIITKEQYLAELILDDYINLDDYVNQFFGNTDTPEYKVAILNKNTFLILYNSVALIEYGIKDVANEKLRIELEEKLNL